MVTGLVSGPTTSERATTLTTVVEKEEQGGRGAGEKNSISLTVDTETRNLEPETPEDDDGEEVSWQSAARASLEKNKPFAVKPSSAKLPTSPVTKKAEPPQQAKQESLEATTQPVFNKQSSSKAASAPPPEDPAQSDTPIFDIPEAQFTREELPADFWSGASESPPPSSYDEDETFETATSTPSSNEQGRNGQDRASQPAAKLPFAMPLFNELQTLFPGRIVRIDMKRQKQTEESEESSTPTNEAVNIVETEESE